MSRLTLIYQGWEGRILSLFIIIQRKTPISNHYLWIYRCDKLYTRDLSTALQQSRNAGSASNTHGTFKLVELKSKLATKRKTSSALRINNHRYEMWRGCAEWLRNSAGKVLFIVYLLPAGLKHWNIWNKNWFMQNWIVFFPSNSHAGGPNE